MLLVILTFFASSIIMVVTCLSAFIFPMMINSCLTVTVMYRHRERFYSFICRLCNTFANVDCCLFSVTDAWHNNHWGSGQRRDVWSPVYSGLQQCPKAHVGKCFVIVSWCF